MAYGTAAGVAALVPVHASGTGDSITFTTSTRPTLTQVTAFLSQVNSLIDSMLAQAGFTTPVTDADVTPMLDLFVNLEVAELVRGVNGAGRFGPTAKRGAYALVTEDVKAYVEANAVGFARMGAARPNPIAAGILSRDTDEAGDETFPIAQRKAFGETFKDWDADD